MAANQCSEGPPTGARENEFVPARMPGRTLSQIVCVAFLPVLPSAMRNAIATHTVGTIAKHPLVGQLIRLAPLSCAAARDPPPACPTRFPRHTIPTMCRTRFLYESLKTICQTGTGFGSESDKGVP
jgi:hypothetical protein